MNLREVDALKVGDGERCWVASSWEHGDRRVIISKAWGKERYRLLWHTPKPSLVVHEVEGWLSAQLLALEMLGVTDG